MKMYLLLTMVILRCHLSFQGNITYRLYRNKLYINKYIYVYNRIHILQRISVFFLMVLLAPSESNNRIFFRYRSPNGSADSRVEAQGIWPSNRVQFRSMEAMISCSHGHFSRTFWRPKRSEEARSLGRPENFQESWFSSIPASPPRQTHTKHRCNLGPEIDQSTNQSINQSIHQSSNQASTLYQ